MIGRIRAVVLALVAMSLPGGGHAQSVPDGTDDTLATPVSADAPVDPATQDPYPVDDLKGPNDTVTAPQQPPVGLALRPAIDPTPLRTVVRPVDPQQSAKLPVTGPIPQAVDREGDARAEYDPIGLKVGSFTVNVTSTSGVGYTHHSTSGNEVYLRSSGEVTGKSDWDSNSVDFTLRGAIKRSVSGTDELKPEGDAILNGSFAITDVDRLLAGVAWTLRDDDDTTGNIHTFSGTVGYERSAGLIGLRSSFGVDRSLYDKGADRDNTTLSGSLRLSLDSGAVVEPFVEGGVFTRLFDAHTDSNGYRRSGIGGELKGGFTIDDGPVTGEISAGYALEDVDDPALQDIRGFIVDGKINWAATELTTVSATLATSLDPTTSAGVSGTVTREGTVSVQYALAPNAYVFGGGGLSFKDYVGSSQSELTSTLTAGAGYRLNRTVELGLTATHKMVDASTSGGDYTESSVEATLTLRH
ncbi:outer membrane beta-barrel protein [Oryzibacter oryziterrae]|uniref:outer membrane beta-barrel protein n=1 Tax=Oryzibacter oryziterrae TaxID=2766474 RepID=UPI001F1CFD15|nr:outer membrane beta-barrel protein [Oryzibacter oryziterrae]